jgi:hypothetical protein
MKDDMWPKVHNLIVRVPQVQHVFVRDFDQYLNAVRQIDEFLRTGRAAAAARLTDTIAEPSPEALHDGSASQAHPTVQRHRGVGSWHRTGMLMAEDEFGGSARRRRVGWCPCRRATLSDHVQVSLS